MKVLWNSADAKPSEDELLYNTTCPGSASGFLSSVQPEILADRGRIIVNEGFEAGATPAATR